MKKITKAVIPAAGLGTRVLPATKAMPKGMLPIVDKPAIQYLVEEAVRSGITDILIIVSRNQDIIQDHFDRSPELEAKLAAPGKEKMLEECLGISNLANIFFVRQQQTLGLGHAVSMAKPFTGDDPFVVIYGDDVIWGEDPVCAQLIRAYEEFGRPAAGVSAVPWADVSRYCSLKTTPIHDNYFFVDDMIEKPKKGQEFSNYSILGRVLLTPEIYDILARTKPGAGGEIQLTDAMAEYARNYGGMTAVEFTGKHYDMGNKLKVAEAQVELALQHPEIGEAFRAYRKEFFSTLCPSQSPTVTALPKGEPLACRSGFVWTHKVQFIRNTSAPLQRAAAAEHAFPVKLLLLLVAGHYFLCNIRLPAVRRKWPGLPRAPPLGELSRPRRD